MYDTSEDEGPSRELYYNEEVQVEEDGQDSDEEAGEMSPGVAGTRGKEKKQRKPRKGEMPQSVVDDIVDIILEDDKFKNKLLLTNVKNVKNGHYYEQVKVEAEKRCKERNEEFPYSLNSIRNKFKKCVSLCRNALMKIKTESGIQRFQEDRGYGSWFGKLLPVVSSMPNSQPDQAIEPGTTKAATNDDGGEEDLESEEGIEFQRDEVPNKTPAKTKGIKRSYVPTPSSGSKGKAKSEAILQDIKGTVESLKNLSSENSSKDILLFLQAESTRQAERDNAFLELMSKFLPPQQQSQQAAPPVQAAQPYEEVRPNEAVQPQEAAYPRKAVQPVQASQPVQEAYLKGIN